jgi:DNA-directed RNA polymerase specialized sigma24 family protein
MDEQWRESPEDRDLLAAARAGDEASFRGLAARHRPGLEEYCLLMLGCPHTADRVVRASLALAWSGIDHAERRPTARIWLYWVATQVCLAEIERRDEGARR